MPERTNEQLLDVLVALRGELDASQPAGQARRTSEEIYRVLIETARDVIYTVDVQGRFTSLNPAFERLSGWPREEWLGQPFLPMIHAEDQADAVQRYRLNLAGQTNALNEVRLRHRNGHYVWGEFMTAPLRHQGAVIGSLGIVRDVTERRREQQALQESESLLAEAQRLAGLGSYRWKAPGDVMVLSRETWRIFGLDPACRELSYPQYLELVHPEDRERVRACGRAMMQDGEPRELEYRLLLPHDVVKIVLGSSRPERDATGQVVGVAGTLMDVTRRKQMEERLLRAQRLEAAGRMAGQVAHDFNNLLGPLLAYPELILATLPPDHPSRSSCQAMMEAAARLADINTDMVTLGRRGLLDAGPVDLGVLVRQTVADLPVRPDVHVELQTPERLPNVQGSAAQLARVVVNLVSNALQAMPSGGTLHVGVRPVTLTAPHLGYEAVPAGSYVRLDVQDSGVGIPPDVRERIFEAFFTTRQGAGKPGTGLGLTVVQAVVSDHHGHLDVVSRVGQGTTFSVYLPVQARRSSTPVHMVAVGGQERVLVVDDEPLQREVMRAMLERLGYRVQTAASGEEAVKLAARQPADLVVLDMRMPPGMDGADTYRELAALHPRQRAILVSGITESDRVQRAQALGAGAHVRKPVTLAVLARAVRDELDRAR